MDFSIELIAALSALVLVIYLYVQRSFNYWENRNAPFIKASFPFGSVGNPLTDKKVLALQLKDFYTQLKAEGKKYAGFYMFLSPKLIIVNPDLIKNVLSKDFNHFGSHGFAIDEKNDPLSAHLFNLDGPKWRNMRVKLTPTFTSGKMKMMFQTLVDCGVQLIDHIDGQIEKDVPLDIKEIMACYTTDIIGSCAFGLDCNSFKDPNAEFRSAGRRIFQSNFAQLIRRVLTMFAPSLLKLFKLKMLPADLESFFMGVVRNLVDYRKLNNVQRNDFLQILIDMNNKAIVEGKSDAFSIKEMTAQVVIFFIAGFETSSTTMNFCLFELVHHQDIQDKIREEINQVLKKYDGKLTYDGIAEMKYLDQVVNETLRKYPPVPFLPRSCTEEYTFSDGVKVEKGTSVFIPTLALHRDEEFFPDPEKFDPERFNDENKHRHPFTYLPFGEGPRVCIGLRFGVMQTKVGLSLLLKNYKLFPDKSLTYDCEFDPTMFVLTRKGKVLLRAEKI